MKIADIIWTKTGSRDTKDKGVERAKVRIHRTCQDDTEI